MSSWAKEPKGPITARLVKCSNEKKEERNNKTLRDNYEKRAAKALHIHEFKKFDKLKVISWDEVMMCIFSNHKYKADIEVVF